MVFSRLKSEKTMTKQRGKSRLTHTEPGETNPLFKIYKRDRNSHSLFLFGGGVVGDAALQTRK